jgi:hypothetical protein
VRSYQPSVIIVPLYSFVSLNGKPPIHCQIRILPSEHPLTGIASSTSLARPGHPEPTNRSPPGLQPGYGKSMRRVVVTGLGAITPLGVGIRRTWSRLLAGESGIVSVADREPAPRWRELTSTVAGLVPSGDGQGQWRASDWLNQPDQRRMSLFTQYAIAATSMALEDAGWSPSRPEDLQETGVCIGSGIGNLEDVYETSLAHNKDVRYTMLESRQELCSCIYIYC